LLKVSRLPAEPKLRPGEADHRAIHDHTAASLRDVNGNVVKYQEKTGCRASHCQNAG